MNINFSIWKNLYVSQNFILCLSRLHVARGDVEQLLAISTAIVLAGGRGLRLAPLTDNVPKALIKIRSKPLLEWVIQWLARNGVSNVVVGVAFEREKIMDYFGDGNRFGIRICYSTHTVDGGTAEGFRKAISRYVTDETFLAMNGDELTNLKVEELGEAHLRSGALATVAVTPCRTTFGIVRLDSVDRIVSFQEKVTIPDTYVSIGTYVFQRNILDYIPETGDIERTTFPALSRMNKLQAYRHQGFWMTVNNLKELQEAENYVDEILG